MSFFFFDTRPLRKNFFCKKTPATPANGVTTPKIGFQNACKTPALPVKTPAKKIADLIGNKSLTFFRSKWSIVGVDWLAARKIICAVIRLVYTAKDSNLFPVICINDVRQARRYVLD